MAADSTIFRLVFVKTNDDGASKNERTERGRERGGEKGRNPGLVAAAREVHLLAILLRPGLHPGDEEHYLKLEKYDIDPGNI